MVSGFIPHLHGIREHLVGWKMPRKKSIRSWHLKKSAKARRLMLVICWGHDCCLERSIAVEYESGKEISLLS